MKELVTVEIIAIYISVASITWNTLNSSCGFAMTTVLELLNFIVRWCFAVPFVDDNTIINVLIPAVFSFFLLTRKGGKGYNSNGNDQLFHVTKVIKAPLICK